MTHLQLMMQQKRRRKIGLTMTRRRHDDCEGDDDENPWLGCVCGKTHPRPIKVFWVQCEICEAWYNVAEECVGFDGRTAEKMDKWCCWACDPPVDGLGL